MNGEPLANGVVTAARLVGNLGHALAGLPASRKPRAILVSGRAVDHERARLRHLRVTTIEANP